MAVPALCHRAHGVDVPAVGWRPPVRSPRDDGEPMASPEPMTKIREPATVRVAMWSSRHRWPVVAIWFVATIGLFVVSLVGGGIRAEDPNGDPNQAQTESAKAYDVFDGGASTTPSEDVLIVVTHPTLKVTDPGFQAFIAKTIADLNALP